jgi:hypothetical protein
MSHIIHNKGFLFLFNNKYCNYIFYAILKSFNANNIKKVFFNTINVIMENLYFFIIEKENKLKLHKSK